MWKYVDDTTISEVVDKGQESCVQEVVDDLATQASDDGFQLNKRKCKELTISFPRKIIIYSVLTSPVSPFP